MVLIYVDIMTNYLRFLLSCHHVVGDLEPPRGRVGD